ncbi:putative tRNA sulfurtransferase [Koleobacter methoxysyntrophicus]|jgi:thiamine biosynthesis protein ThiI|uniref:Probable tRNA sulfurtransferase n=1 Tax=Koleobacter methoxysyntrophicus TaxID=2751313 RepID=A0A8A0RMD0_9FIRM|nr:tRNA uracil 4-sulfurtransferase ThiI [Koleobacter methoxysyntrophicus]QSQ09561.1 putative tRNA sulfurtransferase [Koleobacter methoxysyntrophicus]
MERVYLISYSEIGLKGENRPFFERTLVSNIRRALKDIPGLEIERFHGRIYVKAEGDLKEIRDRLVKIFGIASISPALRTHPDLDEIKRGALILLQEHKEYNGKTFKVETRRPNKSFPLTSPEVSKVVGAHILKSLNGLKVDVRDPDILVNIEIREKAYIYWEKIPGLRGLPVGVSGKALLLLSGGIDSPVAGWMTMKRGVKIQAIYFHTFPFTSDRAKEKVVDLCRVLSIYNSPIILHVVNFTEVLKVLQKETPSEFLTILMRRMMLRIAERVALKENALGLVTGESIGQVASQTMESLAATNKVADIPIIRPLIAFDKDEIIEKARRIGTYEISIRPYEDCCTVFVPRHPKTRPSLKDVEAAERDLDVDNLVEEGLKRVDVIIVS